MAWDYEFFAQKIYELTFIDLLSYKERQMKRRINSLIARKKFDGYEDYYNQLLIDKELLDEFISYITINVSEFFRNPKQWEVLGNVIIPSLFQKHDRLKIWSAACSTGEEPYSLAMLLDKSKKLERVEIIATDIDKDVLNKAKKGIYSKKNLEGLPKSLIMNYFSDIEDGNRYKIDDRLKEYIKFRQHDLLKDSYPSNCHLIICRNVMIYFTEEAKAKLYKKFYNSLHDDGIFFVGNTEQIILPDRYGFEPVETFFIKRRQVI
ncbi:MAG TPA: protein-glutamate O-methyltransferase CheR [Clostridiales bacterium]|nr:protein-glutamate O-methyltransferase CheR [Clostridiales bacterium]